jgi:hypothetical protein
MSNNYNSIDLQPLYGQGEYNSSNGYLAPMPQKKRTNWVRIVVPILVILIAGAIVGGIFGARRKSIAASQANSQAASSAVSAKTAFGRFATATDSEYMVPIYVSTVSRYLLPHSLLISPQRRIPLFLLPPPLYPPTVPALPGHKIHSSLLILPQPASDRTVPFSLRPHISGPPSQSLFRTTHTSRAGMQLFSATLLISTPFLPSFISWMAPAASSITHVM